MTFNMIKDKHIDMDHPCFHKYSKETKDLINKMLVKNPEFRLTPEKALTHKFFLNKGLLSQ